MNRVFVDTGGFFALISGDDVYHQRAHALFQQANDEHWGLVTTNAVLFECYTLLLVRSKPGRTKCLASRQPMTASAAPGLRA